MRVQGADTYTTTATTSPTTGVEKSHVHSTNPAWLYDVVMTNLHATDTRYLMVFDATSLPANGTVPTIPSVQVAAGFTGSLFGGSSFPFNTGITVACSSTAATLTIATTDDAAFFVTSRRK